jgi:CO/xanthine dehydrogenase FAD-binding subunit
LGYLAPTSLDDALAVLAAGDVAIIAGGTDFFPTLGARAVHGDLLDLTCVAGLRGIERTDAGWRIGAATTWSDIIAAPLPPAFNVLKDAARQVGSVQIQNAGTVAGNICNASPAADGVPPLLALDAVVEIVSVRGRRKVSLAEFITGVRRVDLRQGEIVLSVHVPDISEDARGVFTKLGSRKYLVISIAMVAVILRLEDQIIVDIRVAVGSCSPVAQRLPALEASLLGSARSALAAPGLVTATHLAPLAPIDDVRGSGCYRLEAVAELIQRALTEAVAHG